MSEHIEVSKPDPNMIEILKVIVAQNALIVKALCTSTIVIDKVENEKEQK